MVLPLPGLTVLARTTVEAVEADPAAIKVDTVVAAEPGLFTWKSVIRAFLFEHGLFQGSRFIPCDWGNPTDPTNGGSRVI